MTGRRGGRNDDVHFWGGQIGAVIMPHNLFLHSSLVKTREFDRSHNSAVREANVYFALESTISLVGAIPLYHDVPSARRFSIPLEELSLFS